MVKKCFLTISLFLATYLLVACGQASEQGIIVSESDIFTIDSVEIIDGKILFSLTNISDYAFTYGREFDLHWYADGHWRYAPSVVGTQGAFVQPMIWIHSGVTRYYEISFEDHYGRDLLPGRYRFVRRYTRYPPIPFHIETLDRFAYVIIEFTME